MSLFIIIFTFVFIIFVVVVVVVVVVIVVYNNKDFCYIFDVVVLYNNKNYCCIHYYFVAVNIQTTKVNKKNKTAQTKICLPTEKKNSPTPPSDWRVNAGDVRFSFARQTRDHSSGLSTAHYTTHVK